MHLSILTCVLGTPESLHQTFASLKPLLSPRLTWTLKFAATTPEDFQRQFASDHVVCHSLADRSIYEAMTQGLERMEADYYFVLGAGDQVNAAGLQEVLATLDSGAAPEALFCPIIWSDLGVVWAPNPAELPVRMACPHPGAVLRRDRSLAIGGFDPGYRIAADYDHLSRYVRAHGMGQTLPTPLALFAGGGMSEVRAFEGTLEEELIRMRVWKSHEYAVHARLLKRSTQIATSLFDQVAQLHSQP